MRSLIISCFCFVLYSSVLFAQQGSETREEESARVEITARSDQESYRVISCGTDGALVFYKSVESADEQRVKWYFSLYDQDLKQKWVKSLPLLSDLDFRFKLFSHDTLFLAFVYTGKMKSADQPFGIVRIALKTGTFVPNLTRVPANSEPVFFDVLGRNACIALNHKTGQAAVELLDLVTNHSKGFLVDQQSASAFRWFRPDTVSSGFRAVLTKAVGKKEVENWFEVFDTTGKPAVPIKISSINGDREFTGFKAVKTVNSADLIIGSYRLNSGGSSAKNKAAEGTAGIFTSLLANGLQKNLNFFNFLELKSIGTLLSAKDLIDLKKKALKKSKNIGEYSVDFNVVLHDPLVHEGGFIEIAEVYFSQYHQENFTDFDFYGRPYTNSYSVFDGYRFSGAMILAFDEQGMFLWDNAIEIRDLVSPDLNPKVCASFQGDTMMLAYYSGGKVGSKIICKSETTGKLEFSKTDLRYPDDKLMTETRSGLLPWYDNYFICFGFQDIKNVALESNNRRLVFFLSKLKFEE